MKKVIISSIVALFCGAELLFAGNSGEMNKRKSEKMKKRVTEYVNPIIGTNGMGHTFPGACTPFGSIQLSPDTDTTPMLIDGKYQGRVYDYCAGYQYRDSSIVGFSHRHFSGTGHSDLGDILIMPTSGEIKLTPGSAEETASGYRSAFSHESEVAKPGYYSVFLEDYDIQAELTATKRCGIHRYRYSDTLSRGNIILDLNHSIYNYDGKTLWASIRVENDTLITGCRITEGWARENHTYFAISFSKPIADYGYKESIEPEYKGFWRRFNIHRNFPEMAGRGIVSHFSFDLTEDKELVVKVAVSGVSTSGAIKNLQSESSGYTFDLLREKAEKMWEDELGSIEAEGTEDQLTMLYTSYYHTLINPSVYMDVDSLYRGIDQNIHHAEDFSNYTIFSLWDTYRAEHPLLNLMKREENRDMVLSMIAHWEESPHGMLPVWSHMANENWCMSGYHSVSVLAEAIITESITGEVAEKALKAMVETSQVEYYAGLGDYMKMGYVPFDKNSTGASNTLEYSYDDWCIYKAAEKLGKMDIAQQYKERSLYYRNLFDPESGFIRPKKSDGKFKEPFDPLQTHGEGFIEGNSFNFTFHAPHDVEELIRMIGGERAFIKRLDRLFEMELSEEYYEKNEDITAEGILGGYVHGNEPSHHIPYLYSLTKKPWKGQYWLREIMNRMYKNHIDGLSGNDDCGQMSAWYIFTTCGFYPLTPGSGEYVIGTPYLPYIKLTFQNGRSLEIIAEGVSDRNRYVKSVTLNGVPLGRHYITYDEITAGGVLRFECTPSTR